MVRIARKILPLVCVLVGFSQLSTFAAGDGQNPLLKGIKLIAYQPIVEQIVGGDKCKIEADNLNTSLQFVANQSTTLKIISEAELASQYGDRFDRLREASSKLSERLKELPLKESLNLYADKNAAENKELKAAGNAADEYNSVPRLDIDFLPLQIAGGCAATIEASLAAYIEPTTLKHTHAEVDNDTIEIWSVTYGIVGAQPTFSNQAISYAEQAIKKLVNDWTASQN
jgi:hypothetical protein